MSLASRLVNTLFPGQTNSSAPGSESSGGAILQDGKLEITTKNKQESRATKELSDMEETEVEERPPYLHVSFGSPLTWSCR